MLALIGLFTLQAVIRFFETVEGSDAVVGAVLAPFVSISTKSRHSSIALRRLQEERDLSRHASPNPTSIIPAPSTTAEEAPVVTSASASTSAPPLPVRTPAATVRPNNHSAETHTTSNKRVIESDLRNSESNKKVRLDTIQTEMQILCGALNSANEHPELISSEVRGRILEEYNALLLESLNISKN